MGTQVITRSNVIFYTINKKKGEPIKFTKLREARIYGRDLRKINNFKSLKNSNGVFLPL